LQAIYAEYPTCYKAVQEETKSIQSILTSGNVTAIGDFAKSMNFCAVPDLHTGVYSVMLQIKNSFDMVAQFNFPGPAVLSVGWPFNLTCAAAGTSAGDFPTTRTAMNLFLNRTGDLDCFDMNSAEQITGRAWQYQVCSEIDLPIGGGAADVFGPLTTQANRTARVEICNRTFGVMPNGAETSLKYPATVGNFSAFSLPRLIQVNGWFDPTTGFALQQSIGKDITVLNHPLGHCADLNTPLPEGQDNAGVLSVRAQEIALVGQWIEEYNSFHKKYEL
jgi:hypothetical protein